MERKQGIEEQIDSVLGSAKQVKPVDTPFGFTDRAMQRIREQENKDSAVLPAFLKIAAILILAIVNSYTIVRIVNSPPQQTQEISVSAPANVNDLVSEYQANDFNEDILISNTVEHEQP